jgi:hypothetical protein
LRRGCILGSATIGMVVDRIGHKNSPLICTTCFAASSPDAWFAQSLRRSSAGALLAASGSAPRPSSPMWVVGFLGNQSFPVGSCNPLDPQAHFGFCRRLVDHHFSRDSSA